MAIKNIQDIIDTSTEGNTGGQSILGSSSDNLAPETLNQNTLTSQPEFQISPQDTQLSAPKVDAFEADTRTEAQIIQKQAQDQMSVELQKDKERLGLQEQQSFEDQISNILNAPGYNEIQQEQYKKFGVDEKRLKVDEYSTKILAEQDKLRKYKEDVLTKGGGLKIGAQSEIANAERDSLRRQSDLALLQLAAQDQLDYATNVANRAVDAMFDRQEKINKAYEAVYERNKSLFTQAEQRDFDVRLADRNRKLENEKEQARLLQNTKIEALKMLNLNNAPDGVKEAVANAQTPEEVISVGGQYGSVDMLERQYKQAQISSIYFNQQMDLADRALKQASEAKTEQEEKEAALKAAGAQVDAAIVAQNIVGRLNEHIRGPLRSSSAVGSSGFLGTGAAFQALQRVVNPGERSTFLSDLDQLSGILTLENREKLKGTGAISDKETEVAANAASFLTSPNALNAPESVWEAEFGRLQQVFKNAEIRSRYNSFTPSEREELGITLDGIVELSGNPASAF